MVSGSLVVAGCVAAAQKPPERVYCHHWQEPEATQIKRAIDALPDDSPLHPVIRDYERVCVALKD